MTSAQRTRLVSLVVGAGLAWLVGIGWLMWVTLPESAVAHHGSSSVRDRMEAECQGSFRSRYECKEAIIVESGRDSFIQLSLRFLLMIVPPMAASLWLSSYLKRHPVQLHERRHVDPADDWKKRAQFHTKVQSPEEAAHALHIDGELPRHSRGHHHPIEDIAPLEDWKTKAQDNTTGRKR